MTPRSPCPHLDAGHLETELPLDDWLGLAEAIVRCPVCHQHYLIELLDIDGPRRAFRLAPLEATAAGTLIRDLTRGSCDAGRAGSEVHALKVQHPATACVIVSADGSLKNLRTIRTSAPLPNTPWRELPLQGDWLRQYG